MKTYRGRSATYVQAYKVEGTWSGIVYDMAIALDRLSQGCSFRSLTIVRHDNGEREFEYGTTASAVCAHRESQ